MTENQEKELFTTLATLVSGVNQIQSDMKVVRSTLDQHSSTLDQQSSTLDQHSSTLAQHSHKLDHLIAKTDTIADQVIQNDVRLSARLASVEQAVDDIGGKAQ